MSETVDKKHFVLVHGFCHGAWCWYKLTALLKSNGHRVTALDLAGSGVHPQNISEISSIFDYARPLTDLLSSLPPDDKVVLVCHSYGGIPISLAMEAFPAKISLAVFLTAYMPNYTDSIATLVQEYFNRTPATSFMDCQLTFDQDTLISAVFGPEFIASKLYKSCSPEDVELGKVLMRANKFFLEDLGKENLLSEEKYGVVKRCYVFCEASFSGTTLRRAHQTMSFPLKQLVTWLCSLNPTNSALPC